MREVEGISNSEGSGGREVRGLRMGLVVELNEVREVEMRVHPDVELVSAVRLSMEAALASCDGNVRRFVWPGDTAVKMSGSTGGAAPRLRAQRLIRATR